MVVIVTEWLTVDKIHVDKIGQMEGTVSDSLYVSVCYNKDISYH